MQTEQFAVIVWHNDDVNGTHQRVLTRGHTAASAMMGFAKYLQRPAHCRVRSRRRELRDRAVRVHDDGRLLVRG